MIALDTNVLIRYIVQDDPEQAAAATKIIETNCTSDQPGLVSSVVLCELAWVLSRGYKSERKVVAEVIRDILSADELVVDDPEVAWRALGLFENGPADFADYLIAAGNHARGATATYTFDRSAAECELFTFVTS